MPAKLLVMISGEGTNLQALIDACGTPNLPCTRITHVISSKASAAGIKRCQNTNPPIPTTVHNLVTYRLQYLNEVNTKNPASLEARKHFDNALANIILNLPADQKPDLIVCAGYMLILSPSFLNLISSADIPIINLHPALPTAHDGKDAIEGAWGACQAGTETETGVMIHYVIEEVDRGEPIFVQRIPMQKGETLVELKTKIHAVEHPSIVEGARLVLFKRWQEGKIKLEDGEAGFEKKVAKDGLERPVNLPATNATAPRVPID